MLVSTKGRYALRVLVDLAEHEEEGMVSLKDISKRQAISLKYLEIIASMLVKGGIIFGFRGKTGGYKLARKPQEISMLEVLTITEGTVAPVWCLEACDHVCEKKSECRTIGMWSELNTIIHTYFQEKTIFDLMVSKEIV